MSPVKFRKIPGDKDPKGDRPQPSIKIDGSRMPEEEEANVAIAVAMSLEPAQVCPIP